MVHRLPLQIDLALRCLVAYVLLKRSTHYLPGRFQLPYLPFLPELDLLPGTVIIVSFIIVFWLAGLSVLVGYRSRLCAGLLGSMMICEILLSKPAYSTSFLFTSCLLILISQYRDSDRPFRIQLGLLYGGAALNKLLTMDWWDGQYMIAFAETFQHTYAPVLSYVRESRFIAALLGIFAMTVEVILALGVQFRRWTKYVVLIGLMFHGGMLLLTAGQLSRIYIYLISTAYLLILPLNLKARWEVGTTKDSLFIPGVVLVYSYFGVLLLLHTNSVRRLIKLVISYL